jgi:hypothetical protein
VKETHEAVKSKMIQPGREDNLARNQKEKILRESRDWKLFIHWSV